MTVAHYRDPVSGIWVPLTAIQGPPGPSGGLIATQLKQAQPTVAGGEWSGTTALGQNYQDRAGAGAQTMAINFTPPVDCYWEVHGYVGMHEKTDAAYHNAHVYFSIGPTDENGRSQVMSRQTQHSAVQTDMTYDLTATFKLKAGITYNVTMAFGMTGGSFRYWIHPSHLFIEGKAWPVTPVDASGVPLIKGQLIYEDRIMGNNTGTGYSPNISGTAYGNLYRDAAATLPLQINYTPTVDCNLEASLLVGNTQKVDAAYHAGWMALRLDPADVDGVTQGSFILTGHATVMQHLGAYIERKFKLLGGQPYIIKGMFGNTSGGTWRYQQTPDSLFLKVKAWAR